MTVAVCISHQYYFIPEFYENYYILQETDLIIMKIFIYGEGAAVFFLHAITCKS